MTKPRSDQVRVLVYGVDRLSLKLDSIVAPAGVSVDVQPFESSARLQDYDGVVVFQGAFFKRQDPLQRHGQKRSDLKWDRDELHRRQNELRLLQENGGWATFLMHGSTEHELRAACGIRQEIDLPTTVLASGDVSWRDLPERIATLRVVRDTFRKLLSERGAASVNFHPSQGHTIRPVAHLPNGDLAGFILDDWAYFLPVLAPRDDEANRMVSDVIAAVTLSAGELTADVPSWVEQFVLRPEPGLSASIDGLTEQLAVKTEDRSRLRRFKRVLSTTGNPLVEAVNAVLTEGFGFATDTADEFREDLKVLDEDGNPTLLVEVKGVRGGLTREHVNQADSHRERSGFEPTFPTLLLLNVANKAKSLDAKDVALASEQLEHARNCNILVMRTLDLLRLLNPVLSGAKSASEVLEVLRSEKGWLRVDPDAEPSPMAG